MVDPEHALPLDPSGPFGPSGPGPDAFTVGPIWFDEYRPGRVIESVARTVRASEIARFAELSGDQTRLHTDPEFCRRTPFRRPIAHGLLVQSLASGLGYSTGIFEGTIQALGGMTIAWVAPVFPGDTIRLVLVVKQVDPDPSRRSGLIVFEAQVLNQDDRVVSEGEWHTRILRCREKDA